MAASLSSRACERLAFLNFGEMEVLRVGRDVLKHGRSRASGRPKIQRGAVEPTGVPKDSRSARTIGKSAGIHGRLRASSRFVVLIHLSWSWSSSGRGSPSEISANHTRMLALSFSRHPVAADAGSSGPKRTSTPSSSLSSRWSAASQSSPTSTFPPGNSHSPANCSGAVRLATSMRAGSANESTIAPPTTCISPLTASVYEGEWFAGFPQHPL